MSALADLTLTRRSLLKRGGAVAAAAAGGGAYTLARLLEDEPRQLRSSTVASRGAASSFRSRPDLRPTTLKITGWPSSGGYHFLGPGAKSGAQPGPLIVDAGGEVVWFRPLPSYLWATDVKTSSYRGQPVISWWQGTVLTPGYGKGEGVVVDNSYREIARVRGGNGHEADLHELTLTPEGTALITCYPRVTHSDLSAVGGPRDGTVFESIFQEIDLASGRLVNEWRSLEHIPITESYKSHGQEPWDYLHLNSIGLAPDGNLIVSARHTWSIYKLDRRTGQVIWRLGGRRSDFKMNEGTEFAWQHDARYVGTGTITAFDNGSDGRDKKEEQSRGLALAVDERRRTVQLQAAYAHPRRVATAMGNFQTLPNGNALLGWGTEPAATEFTTSQAILAEQDMPAGQQSYRAYRFDWTGTPSDAPALHAQKGAGKTTLYVSWNGATDVTDWHVHAGPAPHRLRRVGVAKKRGFETAIALDGNPSHVAVAAHGSDGRRLGHSETVPV